MGSPDANSKYVLDLDGTLEVPEKDIVAVAKEFQVRSAVDANEARTLSSSSPHTP